MSRSYLLLLIALVPRVAAANPRPLPFTYGAETEVKGGLELEQYADVVPLRALSSRTGAPTSYAAFALQTELEYGLTERLELGLYFTLAPEPGEALVNGAPLPSGTGLKQRLRYRLSDPGEWPLDVALYAEIAETQNEIELEAKIILQRRFGPVRAAINLSAEHELYFDGLTEWVLNPSAGLTVEVTPNFHPGFEAWAVAELPVPAPETRGFGLGPHVYLGPTWMLSFQRLWWTTGVYLRVTDGAHELAPGDAFGRFWVRTVVGFGL